MLLTGKAAVISGAVSSRGIGRRTAGLFAEHGARVAALDLGEGASREAAGALPGEGHVGLRCDVKGRDVCLFLALDLSSRLTGTTIDANGGMLIHG